MNILMEDLSKVWMNRVLIVPQVLKELIIYLGWEDPEYRKCFKNILNGKWEEYDPFDATHRVSANMDLYDCSGMF